MATNNNTILAASWLSGTNDYQQRIPDVTQAGIAKVSEALFDPCNQDIYNQWSNNLINRVGMTIAKSKRFTNPLAVFRKPAMNNGFTIQEIAVKWAKAHSYQDDSEDLLKYERPEFAVAFHSYNRTDRYKVSITRPEMRQAMHDGEAFGLNQLVDLAVSSCTNAEAYDEMQIMVNEFAVHEQNHGMFAHKLSAAPTDKATAQELLEAIKRYSRKFKFPSTLYNAQDVKDVPTFAAPEELVLITVPEVSSVIDVYALAELFNADKASINARVVEVPELPFKDTYAILTTEDAFICSQGEYGMYPFFDPATLTTHQYLHAWGTYSISPFVPMVRFTTEEGTTVGTITQNVTGIDITASEETIEKGGTVALTVELEGNISENEDGITVRPDAAVWSVSAKSATGDPVALNARTYVDKYGVLHCQKSNIESGTVLEVTGSSVYNNPSGATEKHTKTIEVTVA